jgi:hypothetical protein
VQHRPSCRESAARACCEIERRHRWLDSDASFENRRQPPACSWRRRVRDQSRRCLERSSDGEHPAQPTRCRLNATLVVVVLVGLLRAAARHGDRPAMLTAATARARPGGLPFLLHERDANRRFLGARQECASIFNGPSAARSALVIGDVGHGRGVAVAMDRCTPRARELPSPGGVQLEAPFGAKMIPSASQTCSGSCDGRRLLRPWTRGLTGRPAGVV